jgi:hypothetical protein
MSQWYLMLILDVGLTNQTDSHLIIVTICSNIIQNSSLQTVLCVLIECVKISSTHVWLWMSTSGRLELRPYQDILLDKVADQGPTLHVGLVNFPTHPGAGLSKFFLALEEHGHSEADERVCDTKRSACPLQLSRVRCP